VLPRLLERSTGILAASASESTSGRR